MEALLKKGIDGLNLDRSDWQLVKFGDVATQQKQSVDRENTDLTRYVKGEHMYSEDLHLREWGELKDEYLGPAFIRYFEKGDMLYGSRRTYLRKVTIAPFEGITSNTTFVIKANEDLIDKNLLPFLMLSDEFTEHSIRNSKGSVNPYINWKDIANYEFLLPPKEQQAEIAELLWAMDEVIESTLALEENLKSQLMACEKAFFYNDPKSLVKLGTVLKKSISGGTPSTIEASFYADGKIPWITTKILSGDFISEGESYITESAIKNSTAKLLPLGNIVAGTRVGVGKFAINEIDLSFSQDVSGLVVDHQKVDVEFLVYQLNSYILQNRILPFARGTTIKGITKDDLLNVKITLPSSEDQIEARNKIKAIKVALSCVLLKYNGSKFFQQSLINQVF